MVYMTNNIYAKNINGGKKKKIQLISYIFSAPSFVRFTHNVEVIQCVNVNDWLLPIDNGNVIRSDTY